MLQVNGRKRAREETPSVYFVTFTTAGLPPGKMKVCVDVPRGVGVGDEVRFRVPWTIYKVGLEGWTRSSTINFEAPKPSGWEFATMQMPLVQIYNATKRKMLFDTTKRVNVRDPWPPTEAEAEAEREERVATASLLGKIAADGGSDTEGPSDSEGRADE